MTPGLRLACGLRLAEARRAKDRTGAEIEPDEHLGRNRWETVVSRRTLAPLSIPLLAEKAP